MKWEKIQIFSNFNFLNSCFSSKLIILTFIVFCSSVKAQTVTEKTNSTLYEAIHVILKNQYPREPDKTDCMIEDFKQNNVTGKFYTPDILADQEKLTKEIQPDIDSANLKCTFILFFKSPIGIGVLIIFSVLIIIILCLLCCICSLVNNQ